uniref:Uncharacterized protein n=1 Tax=Arion vulgaris TaxID=1028688 RepID=A0A0B6ZDW0_9EUPU
MLSTPCYLSMLHNHVTHPCYPSMLLNHANQSCYPTMNRRHTFTDLTLEDKESPCVSQ